MDFRRALFLHVPLGLELNAEDLASLLNVNAEDREAVVGCLHSTTARKYLAEHSDWEEAAERILKVSAKQSIRWVDITEASYPSGWQGLSCRPVIFSYLGEPVWQKWPLLAVVGSRTPTTETLHWMQRELPRFLEMRQIGIVSGGAVGVDQWGHRLALDSGRPTVCILPSGILNPYPFGCEVLWKRILRSGSCLMSTCGLTEPVRRSFFHVRNRWIAGLSSLVFVVESNRRSGSLLTARLAVEESRALCTLPVFPTATQGLGNLQLIVDGATMIRDSMDLVIAWDLLGLGPTAPENVNSEGEKGDVD